MKIIAGTGHRAKDCTDTDEAGVRIRARNALRHVGAEVFICGMANGFDLWAGDEARLLGIDVWATRPWKGHAALAGDEELYARVLDYASTVVNVVDSETFPGNWCYQKRNEWMVDHATHIMAYMNPESTSGGTFNCVNYARGKKPIRNIWNDPPF